MRIFQSFLAIVLLIGVALLNWNCVPEDESVRQQTDPFVTIKPLPDTVYIKGQEPAGITFEIKTTDGLNSDKISEVTFYKSLEIPIVLGSEQTIKSSETFLTKTSQIPSDLTIGIQELINGVSIDLPVFDPATGTTTIVNKTYNSESDIPGGAIWNIRWEVTANGRTLSPTDTTELEFLCPSNMQGRYIATNDFCASPSLELQVLKDSTSGASNKYIIPDITGNHLAECVGERTFIPFTVTESCGAIEPLSKSFFGLRWEIKSGIWNPNTNTLTIRWTDTYTLGGQIVTSTFIRQ
jgi:hypothetical protein